MENFIEQGFYCIDTYYYKGDDTYIFNGGILNVVESGTMSSTIENIGFFDTNSHRFHEPENTIQKIYGVKTANENDFTFWMGIYNSGYNKYAPRQEDILVDIVAIDFSEANPYYQEIEHNKPYFNKVSKYEAYYRGFDQNHNPFYAHVTKIMCPI